jgi:2-polyprenyl-3-methyl-5-hydroxy-6-metoxy-1,4-benzoquinol methylase
VEISERAVAAARQNFGLEVCCGALEEACFEADFFDAVTMWDVVEHLDDPRATLGEVARITRPGGLLILCTPNCASAFHYLAQWADRVTFHHARGLLQLLYPEKHNTYFTLRTLEQLLALTGFSTSAWEGWGAHVERWSRTTVPLLLRLGTRVVDALSTAAGARYRMVVYARRA